MKNKVIKPFIDAETRARYNAGSFYETADDKRIAYLEQRGFIADADNSGNTNVPETEATEQSEQPDPKPKAPARKKKPKE
ncbi:hypothetical protein [Metabacillus indicus]|uniref:hypothetical protein n=1 Tax=Metabacillus indicus TaxID=246786 RepID=UPI0004939D0A|nr:hypothetical protein [Metabacillus indicus]KEZ51335.1 hypothetical protein AZ46_0212220 [Metabacillus indicus LMG 22858]